jgi:alpha-tubulin suppressor-like RCC1 family protein
LLSDASVKCWGGNLYSQLGSGNSEDVGDDELPSALAPVSITTLPGVAVTALVAGGYHACVLLSDGDVKCWGLNDFGQLGYGNTENIGDSELPSSVGPVSVSSAKGVMVKALVPGHLHTCALLSNGSVQCWGYNRYGQLGYDLLGNIGDDELPSSAGPVTLF